jgi:hypothetical protein
MVLVIKREERNNFEDTVIKGRRPQKKIARLMVKGCEIDSFL